MCRARSRHRCRVGGGTTRGGWCGSCSHAEGLEITTVGGSAMVIDVRCFAVLCAVISGVWGMGVGFIAEGMRSVHASVAYHVVLYGWI